MVNNFNTRLLRDVRSLTLATGQATGPHPGRAAASLRGAAGAAAM
jgi:hypothetical protein